MPIIVRKPVFGYVVIHSDKEGAAVTQRKVVTTIASSTGEASPAKTVLSPRDPVVHRALVPLAPVDDAIDIDQQRENRLGPDFNPDYFETLDAMIEDVYGPITGQFRPVSGD